MTVADMLSDPAKSEWLLSGQLWAEERRNDLLEAWQVEQTHAKIMHSDLIVILV